MQESAIPLCKFISVLLWVVVGALIATAWLTWAEGHASVAVMLCFNGCVTTGMAVTATMRCYCIRLSRIIRTTAIIGSPQGAELRSIT